VKIKGVGPEPVGGPRGVVQGLSDASRRRLWITLSTIDDRALLASWFVRLSWPDEVVPVDGAAAKECLHRFRLALFRAFPGAWFFWVMEVVPRKSGELLGELVPHFHLILNLNRAMSPDAVQSMVVEIWARAIGLSDDMPHADAFRFPGVGVDVRETYGRPEWVAWYLAKYVGKAAGMVEGFSTGRMWGLYGRDRVPKSEIISGEVPPGVWIQFRRLIRGWLSHRGKSSRKFARWIAHSRPYFGATLIGLPSGEALRMLEHAYCLDGCLPAADFSGTD
jgi:hypothetical protein